MPNSPLDPGDLLRSHSLPRENLVLTKRLNNKRSRFPKRSEFSASSIGEHTVAFLSDYSSAVSPIRAHIVTVLSFVAVGEPVSSFLFITTTTSILDILTSFATTFIILNISRGGVISNYIGPLKSFNVTDSKLKLDSLHL